MDADIKANQQDQHPFQTGKNADPDAGPKADAGDSGATVGTPHSADDIAELHKEHVDQLLDTEGKGYTGHNPDPVPNEAYTLPAQAALNRENDGAQPGAEGADAQAGQQAAQAAHPAGDGQEATQAAGDGSEGTAAQ